MTVDLGQQTVMAQLPTAEAAAHPPGSRVLVTLRPDPVLLVPDPERQPTA